MRARMFAMGVISDSQRHVADAEPIVTPHATVAFGAPHLVQGIVDGRLRSFQPELAAAWTEDTARVETTLESPLQREAEASVRVVLSRLSSRHVTAASVVVLDNETSDVLAWVGSLDIFDGERLGGNDGVVALRQPGSALKPFLYGLAMETRGFTPATVLPDVELNVQGDASVWVPQNYDGRFHGPVRLREALGSSLNIPAVWTIQQVGVNAFLDRLRAVGFNDLMKPAAFYGPSLALGDGEVRLLQLTNAYAALSRGGIARSVRFVRALTRNSGTHLALEPAPGVRVMPEQTAAVLTDILKDRRARALAFGDFTELDFPFEVAAKTGTSKGFRDNWTVGYSSAVTVGVWVGNFDATPMQEVSGITGAGPIFHAVMSAAMRTRSPAPLPLSQSLPLLGDADARAHPWSMKGSIESADDDLISADVCALSGERATALCPVHLREWLPPRSLADLPPCTHHVAVRIDARNGLRAGAGCQPWETERRVFERIDAEFMSWAREARRPLIPSGSSPYCPTIEVDGEVTAVMAGIRMPAGGALPTEGARISIARPLSGMRFVIDPERPRALQVLDVDVAVEGHVKDVELEVDGARFASTAPPFRFQWPLVAGAHSFVARAKGRAPSMSAPVVISVRGSD
ncbi:MAG: hypothetical protein NVSMB1_00800 [Polyangiales bacterium]